MYFSTLASETKSVAAIAWLDLPSAMRASVDASRGGEALHPLVPRSPAQQLRDDLRVEDGRALADPRDRGEEVGDVGDAVLEQVADRAAVCGDQVGGVALLDVLRQHQHRKRGVLAPAVSARRGCPRR